MDKYFVIECLEFAVFQGHGFLTAYNGSELSYKISQLRRNTEYKFRVRASLFHSHYKVTVLTSIGRLFTPDAVR